MSDVVSMIVKSSKFVSRIWESGWDWNATGQRRLAVIVDAGQRSTIVLRTKVRLRSELDSERRLFRKDCEMSKSTQKKSVIRGTEAQLAG